MTIELLEKLLVAAKAHGEESDAEHEVGDLQAVLASCWSRLTEAQRREVCDEHGELLEEWLGAR
jgi:hypothetical protein